MMQGLHINMCVTAISERERCGKDVVQPIVVVRYIELNPVRANMIKAPSEYIVSVWVMAPSYA